MSDEILKKGDCHNCIDNYLNITLIMYTHACIKDDETIILSTLNRYTGMRQLPRLFVHCRNKEEAKIMQRKPEANCVNIIGV